jgi:elongation factor P
MISVTELKIGRTFEEKGVPFIVLKYEHIKMGRGTANISIKAKNLLNGAVVVKTYISGAKVSEIATVKRKVQFLYKEGGQYVFMDPKTFEQFVLGEEIISEQAPFLKEQAVFDILFWEDKPLSLELPPKMEFSVVETGPGIKGNSATNIYKPATLDNGLTVKVPLFVETGEKIMIDTRTGEYAERVKKE